MHLCTLSTHVTSHMQYTQDHKDCHGHLNTHAGIHSETVTCCIMCQSFCVRIYGSEDGEYLWNRGQEA